MIICLLEQYAEYTDDGSNVELLWLDENKPLGLKDIFDINEDLYVNNYLTFYSTRGTKLATIFANTYTNEIKDWDKGYERGVITLKWHTEPKQITQKEKFIMALEAKGWEE